VEALLELVRSSYTLLGLSALLMTMIVVLFVTGFVQGREVSFWPPRVGARPSVSSKTMPRRGSLTQQPQDEASPRDEMRRRIRSDIDEAFEQIDVKLRDDEFALFLEAKKGDPKTGYERYAGMFEDSASLQVKAVQDKIDAILTAESRGHKSYNLPVTSQEIESLEKRLDAIRIALPTDLFRGVFWTFKPVTESEWEKQRDRRSNYLRRLEQQAANGIGQLKREFQ
jgi:hypothetical protein